MQKVVNDICDYRKQDQDALNRYDRRLARVQKRVRKGFTKSMEADLQRLDKMREEASRRAWKMNLVYVAIPSWMAMAICCDGLHPQGVRLVMPLTTEEQVRELVKAAKANDEKFKIVRKRLNRAEAAVVRANKSMGKLTKRVDGGFLDEMRGDMKRREQQHRKANAWAWALTVVLIAVPTWMLAIVAWAQNAPW